MANRVIPNPIINSPFEKPRRHFRFDDEGITDECIDGRRPSSYFVPIPRAKKKKGSKQQVFDTEWTQDTCLALRSNFGEQSRQVIALRKAIANE